MWLQLSFYVLLVWEVLLAVLYTVTPLHVVLAVSSAGKLVISTCMTAAFLYYTISLWHLLRAATLRPMYGRRCLPSIALLCCAHDRPDALLNDMSEFNAWRARSKLTRITRVCILYAIASVLKFCIMLYQLIVMVPGSNVDVDDQYWWAVIFFNYFFSEVLGAFLMLWFVRKPSRARKTPASGLGDGEADSLVIARSSAAPSPRA